LATAEIIYDKNRLKQIFHALDAKRYDYREEIFHLLQFSNKDKAASI
jgi:hypothetical protein